MPKQGCLALRTWPPQLSAVVGTARNDPLVHQGRRLSLQSRSHSRASEVPKQALFQRTESGTIIGQPTWKESRRRLGVSKCEAQSRREDHAPLPVPSGTGGTLGFEPDESGRCSPRSIW